MVGVCAGAGTGQTSASAAIAAPVATVVEPSAAADHIRFARDASSVRSAIRVTTDLSAAVKAAARNAAADVSDRAALTEALNRYAGNDFALAVVDNRTGESFRFRPTSRFQTASVMKIDILAAVLLAAQDAGRSLTTT